MSRKRLRNPVAAATLALLAASWSVPLHADGGRPSISANVALGTDYVFRGVSQTLGGAAAQGSVGFELASGLYGYVWGSNVDFVPDDGIDDGAKVEIDTAIGFATGLGERWSVDGLLVHYAFPGMLDAAGSDYLEVIASLRFDDGHARTHAATIAISDDVFGSGKAGLYYGLQSEVRWNPAYTLAAEFGRYDLDDAWGASYSHAGVSLSRSFDILSVTLAVNAAFGETGALFPAQSVGTRAVLTLELGW